MKVPSSTDTLVASEAAGNPASWEEVNDVSNSTTWEQVKTKHAKKLRNDFDTLMDCLTREESIRAHIAEQAFFTACHCGWLSDLYRAGRCVRGGAQEVVKSQESVPCRQHSARLHTYLWLEQCRAQQGSAGKGRSVEDISPAVLRQRSTAHWVALLSGIERDGMGWDGMGWDGIKAVWRNISEHGRQVNRTTPSSAFYFTHRIHAPHRGLLIAARPKAFDASLHHAGGGPNSPAERAPGHTHLLKEHQATLTC